MTSVVRAGHRSARIQRGEGTAAVIDGRRSISSCLHFTCDQTEYSIRYIAKGRVYRAKVLADEWDHRHPPGSTLAVKYDPTDPGRVEISGQSPSRALPTLGASIALGVGALLILSWSYLILRARHAQSA